MRPRALPREYRSGRGRTAFAVITTALAAPGGLTPLWTDDSIPAWVKALVTGAVLGFAAWLITASARAATLVDHSGLQVRGFLGTRRLAWKDIQEIRVEVSAGAVFQENGAERLAYAYGPGGRRVQLMYVDDARVHLDSEIAFLRHTWHTLRGDGWEPVAGLADRIRRGEARRLALLAGLVPAIFCVFLLILGLIVDLFVDLPDGLETVLSPLILFGVIMPVLSVGAASLAYWRRRFVGQHQPFDTP